MPFHSRPTDSVDRGKTEEEKTKTAARCGREGLVWRDGNVAALPDRSQFFPSRWRQVAKTSFKSKEATTKLCLSWQPTVCSITWVSDKIRYDQSSIERVVGVAIAAKPIGAHPKTIPKTIPSGRFAQGAATAKPIGAHPTLGCPFAMYQILSVTHMEKQGRCFLEEFVFVLSSCLACCALTLHW